MLKHGLLAFALLASGCGEPDAPPLPACSAAIPAGASATTGAMGVQTCSEAGAVTAAQASDLMVDGYTTVGLAFSLSGAGPWPHGIDVVLPFSSGKVSKAQETGLVVLAKRGNAPAVAAPVANIFVERTRGKLHFHVTDVATFQVALKNGAGTKISRRYTFRAMAGPSMGGFGASVNFWLHPDRYDAIGVLGADPGPDLTYSLGMIRDFNSGGFCTAADGPNMIGKTCPIERRLLTDQYERGQSFEAWLYEKGDGVGLTLRRNLYLRGNRDLARALGNIGYYNPASSYLPPGVPASTLTVSNQDYCNNPVRLKKYFDARFNPSGTFDVITFCDGNDSEANGYGKIDPSVTPTNPAQILLAVDVNGNGKRDLGEPVLVQANEPFEDVGLDGTASKSEPGYDAVSNPDPAGDDYHYLWNPRGTENNWRYDVGEPYEDVGVDGLPMAMGGCPAVLGTPDCYDYGEGNGTFDYVPNQTNWRDHDPRSNLEKLPKSMFDRLDIYYDAGIRDFFNAQVSTNSLMGALMAYGAPVRIYDGFPSLVAQPPSKEQLFDINRVEYGQFGRNLYVRYGDPDASQATVESSGDGRHVGTATQIIHRIQSMLYWMSARWPNGDRAIAPVESGRSRVDATFVTSSGRTTPYTVVLPPGYFVAENASKTYPVVYLGHGYGMQPVDLAAVSIIAQNGMVDERVPEARRMQKFIIVLVDAACRPGGDVAREPLPTDGDLCEEGNFYTDHPEGTYQGETMLFELQAEIESKFRTRQAADVMVEQ